MLTRNISFRPQRHQGFVLIALLTLLVMGGLFFFISNLTPEAAEARRQQKTNDALTQARDALIGYAVRFRESNPETGTNALKEVNGFLPLPDIGSTKNNNPSCTTEGCDANNFTNNGVGVTVIGRLPWRTLGTGPLRDGHGECLWYVVSGSHQRIQQTSPMNWDTLSQLEIMIADGTAAMKSALASAPHDRPIAVIFSPGPPLAGQSRSNLNTDDVSECGGNYVVSNYLDPGSILLGGTANYFAGTATPSHDNSAAIVNPKGLTTQGLVSLRSDNTLWQGNCPPSSTTTCNTAANDAGLPITSDLMFRTLRASANYLTDINAMLDRITDCVRDDIAGGSGFTPMTLANPSVTSSKAAGRIYSHTCFDDTATPVNAITPKGYFTHYRDQLFVAACPGTQHSVVVDGVTSTCAGALMFAGQRNTATQTRATMDERNTSSNYLEDDVASNGNLSGLDSLLGADFAGCATPRRFSGKSRLASVASGQTAYQDIVRCIPGGASLAVVAPTVTATAGAVTLAGYSAATRTLTLGSAGQNSNYGATAAQLFACAWTPEAHSSGTGLRSYFRFRIRQVGEGFTLAVIDGDRNGSDVCGGARQHLGYSGDNGVTPHIQAPKLAIEFDTARNTVSGSSTYAESGSPLDSVPRNDPCYQSSCGATQNLTSNAHVGIVYWGRETANATVTRPDQDDNVHGFPTQPDASSRPAPPNLSAIMPFPTPAPDPAPGIAPLDRMGAISPLASRSAKREFHARLEITRSFTAPTDPKNGSASVKVQFWIEPHTASNISAMTYISGTPPTLSVTAASHGLATGEYVVIKDAIPTGYNGEYLITQIDTDNFIATLPNGKANPGPYISSMTWANVSGSTDQVTVTSANHGLNTGDIITHSGIVPTEFNGAHTITRVDNNTYTFGLELSYEPGDMTPAIAAARALTARAVALADTTRAMSVLDSTFKPIVSDTATIYDEQLALPADCSVTPCGSGSSCGTDKKCYRPSFRNLRVGFTVGERVTSSTATARGQLIEIKDRATTWLP